MLAPRGTDQSQCRARPRHSARCQRRGGHGALRIPNYNSTKLYFVYFEFYPRKDHGKRNARIILYVAASLQNRHFVMRNQTNRKNKGLSFPVWEIHPVESRSSVAVASRKMVRYGRPAGKRAAAFTKAPGKGGSGPRRRRLAIRHVERVLAPRRGCGRPETPNRLTPGGA